jgi:outer membrane receptor protein involved in Fe transport
VVPLRATSPSPTAAVTLGTEQFSPNNLLKQDILEFSENLTVPYGAHTFTFGGRFENTNMYNNFAQRSYGVWIFPSIAAFKSKQPSGYSYGYANSQDPADIAVDFGVQLFSLYAQDQWAVNPNLTVTAGLRADMPRFGDKPTKNETIAARWTAGGGAGELNTSLMPETQVLLSPRFGFNYDVNGDQSMQVRGNLGVFTGAPPYILLGNAFAHFGRGAGFHRGREQPAEVVRERARAGARCGRYGRDQHQRSRIQVPAELRRLARHRPAAAR